MVAERRVLKQTTSPNPFQLSSQAQGLRIAGTQLAPHLEFPLDMNKTLHRIPCWTPLDLACEAQYLMPLKGLERFYSRELKDSALWRHRHWQTKQRGLFSSCDALHLAALAVNHRQAQQPA